MGETRQPGYGRFVEVTREERQFILAICEEFASIKSPRLRTNSAIESPPIASLERSDGSKQQEA